mmetsp:Transcript_5803/g.18596  ORF Transcript_5803/g.18596 Transcript_5803/m.18596 type:complete len:390 (-) Transcript_5803:1027-2196(-)
MQACLIDFMPITQFSPVAPRSPALSLRDRARAPTRHGGIQQEGHAHVRANAHTPCHAALRVLAHRMPQEVAQSNLAMSARVAEKNRCALSQFPSSFCTRHLLTVTLPSRRHEVKLSRQRGGQRATHEVMGDRVIELTNIPPVDKLQFDPGKAIEVVHEIDPLDLVDKALGLRHQRVARNEIICQAVDVADQHTSFKVHVLALVCMRLVALAIHHLRLVEQINVPGSHQVHALLLLVPVEDGLVLGVMLGPAENLLELLLLDPVHDLFERVIQSQYVPRFQAARPRDGNNILESFTAQLARLEKRQGLLPGQVDGVEVRVREHGVLHPPRIMLRRRRLKLHRRRTRAAKVVVRNEALFPDNVTYVVVRGLVRGGVRLARPARRHCQKPAR